LLIRPCKADHTTEKLLKVLARRKFGNKNLVPGLMDPLTNEDAFLSVSKGGVAATAEKSDAIPVGDNKTDVLAPQIGAHGS
jgi:hypothetical protein